MAHPFTSWLSYFLWTTVEVGNLHVPHPLPRISERHPCLSTEGTVQDRKKMDACTHKFRSRLALDRPSLRPGARGAREYVCPRGEPSGYGKHLVNRIITVFEAHLVVHERRFQKCSRRVHIGGHPFTGSLSRNLLACPQLFPSKSKPCCPPPLRLEKLVNRH